MCPHTPIYVSCRGQELSAPYRICFEASYAYICVLIPLYTCLYMLINVSSYTYMCVVQGARAVGTLPHLLRGCRHLRP